MTKTILPNFLVVGAAKSGTTSLYHYLKQHPDIYLNEEVKESRFFTYMDYLGATLCAGPGDADEARYPKTVEEYKKLFSAENQQAIGEISPDYLYYHEWVIPNIKKVLGDIKIIIILRNPVERAFSSYMHLIAAGRETLDFSQALAQEEKRVKDRYWFIWHYQQAGLYYKQVEDFLNNFTNVKIVLFDDLIEKPATLYKDLCDFIGVQSTYIPDLSKKYNVSGKPKNEVINRFLKQNRRAKFYLKPIVDSLGMGSLARKSIKYFIDINDNKLEKTEMDESIRSTLKKYYAKDIIELQNLIECDLSTWTR